MNKQEQMVYNGIYRGAIQKRATEHSAKSAAEMGLDKYRKHTFRKKVIDLVEEMIKYAVSLDKEKKKNASK